TDFVIALGYKGEVIKRWMVEYASLMSDITVDMRNGGVITHDGDAQRDEWTVQLIDTGQPTATGGRIKRLQPYLGNETCMVTWGEGVPTVDRDRLLEFQRSHGKLATLTAVRPPARFGHRELDGDRIVEFSEKPQVGEGWISGAFFV